MRVIGVGDSLQDGRAVGEFICRGRSEPDGEGPSVLAYGEWGLRDKPWPGFNIFLTN